MIENDYEWSGFLTVEGLPVGDQREVFDVRDITLSPDAVVRGLNGEVIGEMTGLEVTDDGSILFRGHVDGFGLVAETPAYLSFSHGSVCDGINLKGADDGSV